MITRVSTIGFTKTTARDFFERLRAQGVKKIIDVRLNNVSQLSGFAKRDDLKFFAKELCGIEYVHMPAMAPTKDLLSSYRKKQISWSEYEVAYNNLISQRAIETKSPSFFDESCLLCSEDKPHFCHRRLATEYLSQHWSGLQVTHL